MSEDSRDPMHPSDATIRILEQVQSSLAELTEVTRSNGRRLDDLVSRTDGVVSRLDRLEHHAVANHEVLRRMGTRLAFIERVASVATDSRVRIETRMDALEARMSKLEGDES